MTPAFKDLVDDLRSGADIDKAVESYCQKSLLVPISRTPMPTQDRDPLGRTAYICFYGSAISRLAENAQQTDSLDELHDKFLEDCRKLDVAWRPMRKNERWTARDLYMRMTQNDKDKALELLGVNCIGNLIASA